MLKSVQPDGALLPVEERLEASGIFDSRGVGLTWCKGRDQVRT